MPRQKASVSAHTHPLACTCTHTHVHGPACVHSSRPGELRCPRSILPAASAANFCFSQLESCHHGDPRVHLVQAVGAPHRCHLPVLRGACQAPGQSLCAAGGGAEHGAWQGPWVLLPHQSRAEGAQRCPCLCLAPFTSGCHLGQAGKSSPQYTTSPGEEWDIQWVFKSPQCGWGPLAKVGRVPHGAQPCAVGPGTGQGGATRARAEEEVSVCGKALRLGISPTTCPQTERGQVAASRLVCSPIPARSDALPETPAHCSFQYNLYWGD